MIAAHGRPLNSPHWRLLCCVKESLKRTRRQNITRAYPIKGLLHFVCFPKVFYASFAHETTIGTCCNMVFACTRDQSSL